jgi:hypothetical protein
MDPLEAAAQRIRYQAEAAAGLAAAKQAAATQVPASDPDFDALISSFLVKAPAKTAENLVHRWAEERTETHWPPSGIFRRRQKMPFPHVIRDLRTHVVAQGWAFRSYGTSIMIVPRSESVMEDVFARHTIAVTTEGQPLVAVVLPDNLVVVAGKVSEAVSSYSNPELRRLRLGPLVGSPTVAEALNEQFPERGPIVGFHEVQTPVYYRKDPVYDPSFDFRSVHLRKLAEAMVRTLQDLGVP